MHSLGNFPVFLDEELLTSQVSKKLRVLREKYDFLAKSYLELNRNSLSEGVQYWLFFHSHRIAVLTKSVYTRKLVRE